MKKKLLSVGALACAAAMCFSITACSSDTQAEAEAFVSLDINPSIELTLDGKNKVLSVYGANEDGQVLLYGEEGLVGADVEVAVEKITTLAVELGYLDEDNAVVEATVTASNGSADKLWQKVDAKITVTAQKFDLSVVCENEGAYSLLRSLENLKEQYPDIAAVQALTAEQAKLVLSAIETGLVTVKEAAEMTSKELIKLVTEAHAAAKEYATEAYNRAVAAADEAYDLAVGAAVDGIYLTYYTAHYPASAYYGALYQTYKSSARTLYAIAQSVETVSDIRKQPLTEEQIAAVVQLLGLDDATALEDSEGNVTVKSIEAYADKLFKNSKGAENLAQLKKQLSALLKETEADLQETLSEVTAAYGSQISAVRGVVNGTLQRFNGLLYNPAISEEVKTLLNDASAIADEIDALVSDGELTADEIRSLAETLDGKAAEVLAIIESKLTEEEIAEIAALQQKATESLATAKQQYENAVQEAASQAKQRLEELKAARRGK